MCIFVLKRSDVLNIRFVENANNHQLVINNQQMSNLFGDEQQSESLGIPVMNESNSLKDIARNYGKKIFTTKLLWVLLIAQMVFNISIHTKYNETLLANQKTDLATQKIDLATQKTDYQLAILKSAQKDIMNSLLQTQIKLTYYQLRQPNNNNLTIPRNTLPLTLPFLNQQNQGIEEVLYDEQTRRSRVAFYNDRVKFIDSNQHLPSLSLAKYNLILTLEQREAAQTEFDVEWQRIEKKFGLSKITEELPMCLIVPGYNNNAKFRIESNLNSIFTQNYSNYKVVIINDASTDGSGDTYRRYFEFYGIDPAHYTYIENTVRVTAVENIYIASTKHCGKDEIVVTIDADDELIGRNALKVFNWGYQTKKLGVLYSNFYFYEQNVDVQAGFTQQHTEEEKRNNLYRDLKMKFSHLRSYRNELFLRLDPADLKDETGQFYKIIYDQAIFFPLMEMSCGRVAKIEGEFHLLYTMGTGLNDIVQGLELGARAEKRIRQSKKYGCLKQFDEKMKAIL